LCPQTLLNAAHKIHTNTHLILNDHCKKESHILQSMAKTVDNKS